MTKQFRKIQSNRINIVYRDRDHRNRQELIVRGPKGNRLFSCRRVSSLMRYLEKDRGQVVFHDKLPQSVRDALIQDRVRSTRIETMKDVGKPERLTLGSMFPELITFGQAVPKYHAG